MRGGTLAARAERQPQWQPFARLIERSDDVADALEEASFVLSLIAQSHEKLGDQASAMDYYRKVMAFTTHNPNNAFARPLARKKLGL